MMDDDLIGMLLKTRGIKTYRSNGYYLVCDQYGKEWVERSRKAAWNRSCWLLCVK